MKTLLRHIVANTYKPMLEKYLSKTRRYRYRDIELEIAPEVFHPRFFFSTRFLLDHIRRLPLTGKRLLEPGCGSGLISIYAAKQGAIVTALDINPVAVKMLMKNSRANNAELTVLLSDLFDGVPAQKFDIIAINPPYYRKDPAQLKDYAWYCGENGEFFDRLFRQLKPYMHTDSEAVMVLSEGCDMEMISGLASLNGFMLRKVRVRQTMLEKNFIFRIEQVK